MAVVGRLSSSQAPRYIVGTGKTPHAIYFPKKWNLSLMSNRRLLNSPSVIILFILIILNLIIFSNIFPSFFFADDFFYIHANIASSPLELLGKAMYLSFHDFFRPVFYMIFGLNYAIFHLYYHGYYAINLLFHLLNGYLVFILCSKLMKNRFSPSIAAILFTVFPGHWEAIGWLNPINHLTMTAAYLTALILFNEYLEKKRTSFMLFSSLFYFLALSCHEGSLTFIIMAAFLYLLKTKKIDIPDAFAKLWPYLTVLFIYFIINIYTKIVLLTGPMQKQYYLGWHFIPGMMDYLSTLIIPATIQYKLHSIIPGNILNTIILAKYSLYIILPIVLFIILFKGDISLKFFSLWPVIAFIPFSFFTTPHTSRYMYLASVGFCSTLAIVGMNMYDHARSRMSKLSIAMIMLLIMTAYLLTSIAYQKVFYYKKEIRRQILLDFKKLSPTLDQKGHYYFANLPITENEITYMLYLWFNKDRVDIRTIDNKSLNGLVKDKNTHIFDYERGHLVRIK